MTCVYCGSTPLRHKNLKVCPGGGTSFATVDDIVNGLIEKASNQYWAEIIHGAPLYLYYKASAGKIAGDALMAQRCTEPGFAIADDQAYRGNLNIVQLRNRIRGCLQSKPILPTRPIPAERRGPGNAESWSVDYGDSKRKP
jgi:hypothetical protein